ncbi:MAG: hypothetical protein GY859_42645 [Desulfobacterales bacterium]|nr:hypothetical protein [Desulfobacterales bacterium]
MRFLIKQYLNALAARKWWLLASLIPLACYLAFSAARADRFTILGEISISADTPISLSPKAGDTTIMRDVLTRPASFFQNKFALSTLAKTLRENIRVMSEDGLSPYALKNLCADAMTISTPGKGMVRITFNGKNRELGETMVGFYTQRLIQQANVGMKMARPRPAKKAPAPHVVGEIQASGHRALWRPERFLPALQVVITSLLIILVLVGVIGWLDPSFKSERQVARYLKVPVLGSLPNLQGVSAAMKTNGG